MDDKTGDQLTLARITRLIVFEILHESAVEPTPEAMLRTLDREVGSPEPFEHMLPPGAIDCLRPDRQTIEEWRNRVGNLHSGVCAMGYPSGSITVRYFMDRAVVLLGSVYNKCAYGFFDEHDKPRSYVAEPHERLAFNIARAASKLYRALKTELARTDPLAASRRGVPPSIEELSRLALSTKGSEELFKMYPRSQGVPLPTDERLVSGLHPWHRASDIGKSLEDSLFREGDW